jgi:nicotinate phosphoribosyltransferase
MSTFNAWKTGMGIAEGILFTDFYELTMAQFYYRTGLYESHAQFDYFFRNYPDYGSHKAGYCINAGLEWLIEWMQRSRFGDEEIELLRGQKGRGGKSIFDDDFLKWLRKNGTFDGICIKAIPEGRVIHPNVPIVQAHGPLVMAQILESSLLNNLNYQTLIATKASRVRQAGYGNLIIEFGLRRGHHTGVNAGTRAALIGGADFSSNTGISCVLGCPPKGTHAHSMVQIFMAMGQTEIDAFRAYSEVYPDDCLLLVDTVDTLQSGIPNAIRIFEELRNKGHKPAGIRLDSGDLAHLCIKAAKMLNDAGFEDTTIVLSNTLDELVIWQIIEQIKKEAPDEGLDADSIIRRLSYGVGTRLITSEGDSSLDGVYKLAAVERDGKWQPAIKVSETPLKTINPGLKKVWRIYNDRNKATADLLGLIDEKPQEQEMLKLRHPTESAATRTLTKKQITRVEPLLVDVLKEGKLCRELPTLAEIRKLRDADLGKLDEGVKRLINPHIYHVSITEKLWDLKQDLIRFWRG